MTIASKSSPHLQGLCVTSNVQRSMIRVATPYCLAARITPGGFPEGTVGLSTTQPNKDAPFPLICLPSMSDPNTRAPKCAVGFGLS